VREREEAATAQRRELEVALWRGFLRLAMPNYVVWCLCCCCCSVLLTGKKQYKSISAYWSKAVRLSVRLDVVVRIGRWATKDGNGTANEVRCRVRASVEGDSEATQASKSPRKTTAPEDGEGMDG
jgi:hypothetical protein